MFYRIQCRSDAGSRIVHFVSNHADYFLIGFLFRLHHFVGKGFHQIERVLESTIDKRGMSAPVDIRVVQTDGNRLSFRKAGQFHRQRRINLFHFLTLYIFQTNAQHLQSHRVQFRKVFIKGGDDNSHWRSLNQQIKKVILLTQAKTFILELFHHAVEDIHHTIGFILSYRTKTATEILLTQQFHTASDGIQRFHYLTIEECQIKQDKKHQPLSYVEKERVHLTGEIEQYTTQCQQQNDKYVKKSFYTHVYL